jgi:hypothetical protein
MNIKELIKLTNYRLAEKYYNDTPNLKEFKVVCDSLFIEYNIISIYYSLNSDYHVLIINDRVKLFKDAIKLYDRKITAPIERTNTINTLLNKYVRGVACEN